MKADEGWWRDPWPRDEVDDVVQWNWRNVRTEDTPYAGFLVEDADSVPSVVDGALEAMTYSYDVVQPLGLGTALARTKVQRCLVGDEGATYKYLGLRLFAAPWPPAIKRLNAILKRRSEELGATNARFTVALINKMDPTTEEEQAVSWHADSSLEHGSTIAVFQSLAGKHDGAPWKLALRVRPHAEGPRRGLLERQKKKVDLDAIIQPVHISLEGRLNYYMLNTFNHMHQHAVLRGTPIRYSSTHRVARKEGHTAEWVLKLGRDALAKPTWRSVTTALDVIEFDWLRQWFIQGFQHARRLTEWAPTIDRLAALWLDLERQEYHRIRALLDASDPTSSRRARKKKALVDQRGGATAYDAAIDDLLQRRDKRRSWHQRETDSVFLHTDHRPILPSDASSSSETTPGRTYLVACQESTTHDDDRLPYILDTVIDQLRTAKIAFLRNNDPPHAAAVDGGNQPQSIKRKMADETHQRKKRKKKKSKH